jgi:hypothetical protein
MNIQIPNVSALVDVFVKAIIFAMGFALGNWLLSKIPLPDL